MLPTSSTANAAGAAAPSAASGSESGAPPATDVFGNMLEVNEEMLTVAAECHARGDVEGSIAFQRLLHRRLVEMAGFVDARFGVYARSDRADDAHDSQDSSDESDVSMDEEPAADSATTADETDTGDVAMIPASTTATASDLQGIDAGAGILDTGTAAASALQTLAADEAAKIKHRNKKLWMRAREQVREQETAAAAKNAAAERMATVTASIIKEAAVVPAPTVSPEVLAMQAAFQLKVSAALAAFAASALTGATNKSTASSANASTPANANLPSDLGAAVDTATSTVVATEEPVASEAPTPLPTPSTRKNTIDVPGSSESTGVCADAVANEDQVVTEVADTSASILIPTAQLADSTAQSDKLSATEVPAPVPTGSTAIPPEPPAILPVVSSQPENTAALSLPASTNDDVPAEMTPELAIPTPNDNDKEPTSAETNSFDPTNTTKMALPPPQSLVNVMYPVAATMYPPMQLSTICPMCALQNKTAAECRMMLKHVTPSILLDPTMIASLGFQWPPRPAIMETPVAPAQPQLSTLPVVSRRQTAESTGFKRMCEACRKCHQSVHRCRVVLQHTAPEWQPTTQVPPRRRKSKKEGNPKHPLRASI